MAGWSRDGFGEARPAEVWQDMAGTVRHGFARRGLHRHGRQRKDRRGWAWPGVSGSGRYGVASQRSPSSGQAGVVRIGRVRLDTARPGRFGKAPLVVACRGVFRFGRLGTAWPGSARRDQVWQVW